MLIRSFQNTKMADIAGDIVKDSPRAIAKAISWAENNRIEFRELMREIFPYTGKSAIVGITGASGTGKSTLASRLIKQLIKDKKKVGVVAVDPSSPFSKGAFLGDRIRMMQHSVDSRVFIRSMATRGHEGGLARATGDAIAVLEAAGKDFILVETVGAGQDEVDVLKLADIVLVVLMPGQGDDIQISKAGIMEIANIFVLNKADSPGIEVVERQVEALLELNPNKGKRPPIIRTIATTGKGIHTLVEKVIDLVENEDIGLKEARKRKQIASGLKDIITVGIYQKVWKDIGKSEWDRMVDSIFQHRIDIYTAADEAIKRIKG